MTEPSCGTTSHESEQARWSAYGVDRLSAISEPRQCGMGRCRWGCGLVLFESEREDYAQETRLGAVPAVYSVLSRMEGFIDTRGHETKYLKERKLGRWKIDVRAWLAACCSARDCCYLSDHQRCSRVAGVCVR